MGSWPGKLLLTAGVLLAIVAAGALFRRWRTAPLLIGSLALATIFIWASFRFGPDAAGLKLAGLSFATATAGLIIAAMLMVAWQLRKAASSSRLPKWVRFIAPVIALYAIGLIALGIARGSTMSESLSGTGFLPWWISGQYLGSAILLPIGFIFSLVSLGFALARRRAAVVSAVAVMFLMLSAFVVSGLELTRNGRPNLAQFILPQPYGSVSGNQSAAVDQARDVAHTLGAGEESLAPFEGKDIDDIFARVATGVRYEPYSGILRGAIGTAIAKSGNSADQSMLLAEVLRRAGYRVRYARGVLADNNIDLVVRGMYPPGVVADSVGPEYLPYDPTTDAGLRALVRNHMWVEVFQGQTWLPLDPSFPRAKIGEAYAQSTEQLDAPADAIFHTVEASLKEETQNGQTRELARFRVKVADVAFKPITLAIRAIPQSTGGDAAQNAMAPPSAMGGMGGALGGATEAPKPEPPKEIEEKIVGVAYVRTLTIGNSPQKVARTTVLDAKQQSALKREWIEFNVSAPGKPARRIERVLYTAGNNAKPADSRTYTISMIPGRVPRAFAAQQTRLARTLIDPAAMQQKAKSFSGMNPDDPKAEVAAAELGAMAADAGTVGGQLLALRFAAESDSISRLIGDGSGVALAWEVPRILITGVEIASGKGERIDAKVSLDLRLDEIKAYPYRGTPTRMTNVFQAARGIQESVIEGSLVAVATGRAEAATTAQVMRAAEKEQVPLLVISSATSSRIPELVAGLPAACIQLVEAALSQGREIVIPSRAVTLDGVPQFGWWDVDPLSGSIVGVMQDGQHQGTVEYSLAGDKIALNDKTGKVIGMIIGSITTVGTMSALLLEYGDVTPELVTKLEVYVKKVMCVSCFDKIQAKVAIQAGGDCLKEHLLQDYKKSYVNVKVSFCDEYFKGFKCAASLILANLKNENMKQFIKADAGASVSAGCEKLPLPKLKGGA